MTANMQAVVEAAQALTPSEQLEVISMLSRMLQQRFPRGPISPAMPMLTPSIPPYVRRSAPITDLSKLAADFWPDDESADAVNAFVAQQRAGDRQCDLPDFDEDA